MTEDEITRSEDILERGEIIRSEESLIEGEVDKSKLKARKTIMLLKGTEEYARYVDDLSRKVRIGRVTLFDIALAEWAQRNGHGTPPPRL